MASSPINSDDPEAVEVAQASEVKPGPEPEPEPEPVARNPLDRDGVLADSDVMFDQGSKRGFLFWTIMASLTITGLMSALEGTIITSVLPTITEDLRGGSLYFWVPNAFFLSFISTLPFFAQISDIFGRRWPFIAAVALFTVGSGICGGSSTMRMLVAGRTVQGIGGGGIQLLTETIITDLVPLRERGFFIALTMVAATIGAAIGPFIAGLIAERSS
ncbi:hypothetical protein SLS62_003092 [Diatrype stigma]|uniref:Major facilitator superfamily (MFS) profile domain-containing protein n=1 Tax=Diatrype stigma TaxID=117547 RepID=A0AAN9UVJ4_9PEZI